MAWMPVVNAVIWSFGVNLSVIVVAFLFERKLENFKQWKFIFVGVYYGAVFVLLTLLVSLLTKVEALPSSLFQSNFLDGLWLGLSLGAGIEIAESILHSIDSHVHAVQETQKVNVGKSKGERVVSPNASRKKARSL
jgi:cadmium resistance protein CadD (predicted permease)